MTRLDWTRRATVTAVGTGACVLVTLPALALPHGPGGSGVRPLPATRADQSGTDGNGWDLVVMPDPLARVAATRPRATASPATAPRVSAPRVAPTAAAPPRVPTTAPRVPTAMPRPASAAPGRPEPALSLGVTGTVPALPDGWDVVQQGVEGAWSVPDRSPLPTQTPPSQVTTGRRAAGWRSGAAGEGVADGSFGAWRGTPVQVAGTWNDTTDAVQRAQSTLFDEYADYDGDLDVAVGGLDSGGGESWAQAAAGAYLDRWTQIARALARARAGKLGTTYVRFAHEMNGDWYGWRVTSADVSDFRSAWRKFREVLRREFPRAQLVFGANAGTSNDVGPAQIWPGDDVVDVVGVDFYDGWPRFDQATWSEHLDDTDAHGNPRGIGAWQAFAAAHGKPLAFPEWGLNPAAGNTDNPFFIQAMHDFFTAHAATPGADLAGKVIYDLYYETESDGFRITSAQNAHAGNAYRSLAWGTTGGRPLAAPAAPAAPAEPLRARDVLLPSPAVQDAAAPAGPAIPTVRRDLVYATTSPAQRLDLYLPARRGDPGSRASALPLVVLVHGAGVADGDKAADGVTRPVRPLLDHGFAVASVNYRLPAEAPFPAGLQDVSAAVRWLRAHAGAYGLDPQRFAAWGSSTGGYLATMLGVTGDRSALLGDPALGDHGVSSTVQAVVDGAGQDGRALTAQQLAPGIAFLEEVFGLRATTGAQLTPDGER